MAVGTHVLLRFGWLLDDSAEGALWRFLSRAETPGELLLADDRRDNPSPVDDDARVIISVLKQLRDNPDTAILQEPACWRRALSVDGKVTDPPRSRASALLQVICAVR